VSVITTEDDNLKLKRLCLLFYRNILASFTWLVCALLFTI